MLLSGRGDLLSALLQLDKEDDVNKVLRYFSYEHFYVIYCKVIRRLLQDCLCFMEVDNKLPLLKLGGLMLLQFWELDADHDFFICKEDLLRYGNHSLTYRIVDRIFSQVQATSDCAAVDSKQEACSTLEPLLRHK